MMNWYKVAQTKTIPPIQILSYNYTTNILKVNFNGEKGYTYKVTPDLFYRIKKLLEHHNFSLVSKILRNKAQQEKLNNLKLETKEEQNLILKDLEDRGIW